MVTEVLGKRYASHIPLDGVGEAGQRRIRDARVLVAGVGGLGCAAAQYLVSSGIGKLTLCDFDTVAESNLGRQILYRVRDLGRLKVDAAVEALQELNPDTELQSIPRRLDDRKMQLLFPDYDLIIDASDNYGTRLAVNRNCLVLGLPWVMGSCIRMEAQIMLLKANQPEQACYRCVYGEAPETLEDCPGAGIFAPVAGIAGTSAAHFALASLAGISVPHGLHLLDASNWDWRTLKNQPESRL